MAMPHAEEIDSYRKGAKRPDSRKQIADRNASQIVSFPAIRDLLSPLCLWSKAVSFCCGEDHFPLDAIPNEGGTDNDPNVQREDEEYDLRIKV
jgi:hypothetical protein